MILNARQNLFDFRFPKGFFFPEIEEKYKPYIRALPLPIDNVSDFKSIYNKKTVIILVIPKLNKQSFGIS
jgi:hypothetical protein